MICDATASNALFCLPGLDGWMLANLTAGMAPVPEVADAVVQCCLTSLLRLISMFYIASFDGIVSKNKAKRHAKAKRS